MSKSTEALARLLEERLRPGADVAEIDRRIQALFGETWCILFTDMAGFSRRAARDGIISFLALIHQMERICVPIVHKNAGLIVKKIADSLMVLFRDPRAGLRAAVEIQQALRRRNDQFAESDHIYVGCGIGHGSCIKLGDEDVYGIEVNFAAKLGEDLAGPYEIFITPAAMKAIGTRAGAKFRKVPGSRLGKTKLPYYEVVYELPPEPEDVRKAKRSRVRFR